MKRDKIDEILSVIDTGLQSTAEASYGETPWDGANVGDPTCIRCDRDLEPDTGEICSACRAYLLGDTPDDPAGNGPHDGGIPEEFAPAVEELGRALADALRPIAEIVLALPEQTRALILGEREPTDDEIDRLVAELDEHPVDAAELAEAIVWIEADPTPFEEAIARFRSITPTEETDRATPPPPEDPPVTEAEVARYNELRASESPSECGMCWRGPGSNEACSEHAEEADFRASFCSRYYNDPTT